MHLVIQLSRGFQIFFSFVQPKLYEKAKTTNTENKNFSEQKRGGPSNAGQTFRGSTEHSWRNTHTTRGFTCHTSHFRPGARMAVGGDLGSRANLFRVPVRVLPLHPLGALLCFRCSQALSQFKEFSVFQGLWLSGSENTVAGGPVQGLDFATQKNLRARPK